MTISLNTHPLISETLSLLHRTSEDGSSTQRELDAAIQRVYERVQWILSVQEEEGKSLESAVNNEIARARNTFDHLHLIPEQEPAAPFSAENADNTPVESLDRAPISLYEAFELTPPQKSAVKEMLNRWQLGENIALASIFGVELYCRIKNLKPYFDQDFLNRVLSSFCLEMFDIYSICNLVSLTEDLHARKEVVGALSLVQEEIRVELLSNNEESKVSKKGVSSASPKKGQKAGNAVDRMNTILSTLLEKVLPYSGVAIKASLNFFPETSIHCGNNTIEHLELYAEYCASMLDAKKKKMLSPYSSYFRNLAQICKETKGLALNENTIGELKTTLTEGFSALSHASLENTCSVLNFSEAEASQQKKMKGSSKTKKKGQQSTAESLQKKKSEEQILLINVDFIFSQFQHSLDERILQDFPHFSSMRVNQVRFVNNLRSCPREIPLHEEIDPPAKCSMDFNQIFCDLITPIEISWMAFLNNPSVNLFKEKGEGLIQLNNLSRNFHSTWVSCFLPFLPICDIHLTPTKKELAKIPDQLMQILTAHFANFSLPLSDKEKTEFVSYIQDVCFNQSLFLAQMVMMLEDLETIINGKFSLEYKHLPQELANIMYLSGVADLIDSLPPVSAELQQEELLIQEDSPVVQEEDPAFENSITATPLSPAAATISPLPQAAPLSMQSTAPRRRPPPVNSPATAPRQVPVDLRGLIKLKHILERLNTTGFYLDPTRENGGSHHIYKNLNDGRQATVSYHSEGVELPIGTVRSIERQANSPPTHPRKERKKKK